MYNFVRKAAIPIIILTMLVAPIGVMADGEMNGYENRTTHYSYDNNDYDDQVQTAKMVADTLLVRPLGIVSTALGFGFFVISVPFSALGSNTGEAWHYLVVRPAEFTFVRPLGEFN